MYLTEIMTDNTCINQYNTEKKSIADKSNGVWIIFPSVNPLLL